MRLGLDAAEIATSEALHVLLESNLEVPGDYGRNWDAFSNCTTDLEQSTMPELLRVSER